MTEVQRVREAVRRDLAKVFNRDEGAGFGIFGSGDEDDHMVGFLLLPTYSVAD
jgi:hypothetical protein